MDEKKRYILDIPFSIMYPSFEYWILIPKMLEITLFLFLSVKMFKLHDYTLNRLLALSFLVWGIYIITDSFMYITAANSMQWYNIIQVVRDFSMYLAFLMAFLIYISVKIVKEGEMTLKRPQTIIIFVLFIILAIMMNINDTLVVINSNKDILNPETFPPNEPIQVVYQITPWLIISSAVPILMYLYSVAILAKFAVQTTDLKYKTKMLNMAIGIFMIPFGMLYFIFIGLFIVPNFLLVSIGHIIWMIAPILIWKSQL
jgi:hypothetical protein